MKLVSRQEHLDENIHMLENYLADRSGEEQLHIRDLIRRGKCFVAYKVDNEIRFAPSRFIGYVNNDLKKHFKARSHHEVDGRDTNPAISKLLNERLQQLPAIEKKYLTYCRNLGVTPGNYKNRRYWLYDLKNDFAENLEQEGEFPEGRVIERIHKSRERKSKVIEIAKENFKMKNKGKLFCEACGFDFEKVYGEIGKNFIEGHHTIAVADMEEGHITKPEEIALLCSNCHRMVHKKRPWLSMKQIKQLIKNK